MELSIPWMKILFLGLAVILAYYAIRRLIRWVWLKMIWLHKVLDIRLQVRFRTEGKENPGGSMLPQDLFAGGSQLAGVAESGNYVAEQDLYGLVYRLSGEVQRIIHQAALGKWPREELVRELRDNFRTYRFLKTSPYRFALDNLVSSTCEKICAIRLNEEELNGLWKG
ncbi:MAG TPA: hypothetical protein VNE41_10890 [Chitinophagaceae bacterium]|nr:hypothetical protein [Chitinophagaceae bacterium]